MNNDKDSDNNYVQNLMESTKDLMKDRNYKKVFEILKRELKKPNASDELLPVLMSLGSISKQSGDSQTAYSIFSNIYTILSSDSKLGPNHKDVLKIKVELALSSGNIPETNRLLLEAVEECKNNDDKEIEKIVNEAYDNFLLKVPDFYKKAYTKLRNRKTKDVKITETSKEPIKTIEEIMKSFE